MPGKRKRGLERIRRLREQARRLRERLEARHASLPGEKTYRSRLRHLDRYLLNHHLRRFRGKTLRYLDAGCGVRAEGAPTTMQTRLDLLRHGIQPDIVATALRLPRRFSPLPKQNQGIRYIEKNLLEGPVEGVFDVVRGVNLYQDFEGPGDWFAPVRRINRHLAQSVADGGFLVVDVRITPAPGAGHPSLPARGVVWPAVYQRQGSRWRLLKILPPLRATREGARLRRYLAPGERALADAIVQSPDRFRIDAF